MGGLREAYGRAYGSDGRLMGGLWEAYGRLLGGLWEAAHHNCHHHILP